MLNNGKFERAEMDQLHIVNFSRGYNFYWYRYAEIYPLLAESQKIG
jgi:hypothetical protein